MIKWDLSQGWVNIQKSISVINHVNKLKNKNYMIIPIGAEKAFDKIQHPFMFKNFQKMGIEEAYLNLIKCHRQTERYPVLMNWKYQYCQNEHLTQGNLQIQCNPYQNINGSFHITRTKIP